MVSSHFFLFFFWYYVRIACRGILRVDTVQKDEISHYNPLKVTNDASLIV